MPKVIINDTNEYHVKYGTTLRNFINQNNLLYTSMYNKHHREIPMLVPVRGTLYIYDTTFQWK